MLIQPNKFWKWAYSDFISNANRGILAEYIVHTAIQSKTKKRLEWDSCDLITQNDLKIEVKCSAYLQSWQQTVPSKIIFNIAPTKEWHFDTNTYDKVPTRSADIYVFCIFKTKDPLIANPLDTSQWEFIVIPTIILNQKYQKQKSISYNTLIKDGFKKISYENLALNLDTINMGQIDRSDHAVRYIY